MNLKIQVIDFGNTVHRFQEYHLSIFEIPIINFRNTVHRFWKYRLSISKWSMKVFIYGEGKFSKRWPRLWTKSKILNKIGHLYIDMGSTIIIKTCYIWIALPLWRTYNTRKLVFKKVCLRTVHRQMHCHHLLIGHGCPAGLMYTIFAGLIRVLHSIL